MNINICIPNNVSLPCIYVRDTMCDGSVERILLYKYYCMYKTYTSDLYVYM